MITEGVSKALADIRAAGCDADADRIEFALAPKPAPDRDIGGRVVREAWVRWALTQPDPKPSWLAPYDELSEPDKEADRQIFEACAKAAAGVVPALELTEDMVREAEAHVPSDLPNPEKWRWLAEFLNKAVLNPDTPCPCCNVTPAGDVLDHLPTPS